MCQYRERQAGKKKHSHAEYRVWIVNRHTCSLVDSVIEEGLKGSSNFNLCTSASLGIGLPIYEFLRKTLAAMAKKVYGRSPMAGVLRVVEKKD
jgi:hypothetical protein